MMDWNGGMEEWRNSAKGMERDENVDLRR